MAEVTQWKDIQNRFHQGSLLLGNGASIAVNQCFNYRSLYEKAVEMEFLTPEVQMVFDKFKVNDFELVLRRLWQAKLVNEALSLPRGEVENAYQLVRQALIQTVRETHIAFGDAMPFLEPIFQFLRKFDTVISLNYDLLLYWAAQSGNHVLGPWFKDCFLNGEFRSDWETVKEPWGGAKGATLYFYPHGNLVLCRDGFSRERKISADGEKNLLEKILSEWERKDLVPAFVCEGTKENKQNAISSCNYFERVYFEVLPTLSDTLTIFGWGFGTQDQHILQQIKKSKVKRIAVSVFEGDSVFKNRVEQSLEKFELDELIFFDAKSEGCWINSSIPK